MGTLSCRGSTEDKCSPAQSDCRCDPAIFIGPTFLLAIRLLMIWKKKRSSQQFNPDPRELLTEVWRSNPLNVRFEVLRRSKYQDKVARATLKNPSWLSDLQPSAPLEGYLMENGEFSASLCGRYLALNSPTPWEERPRGSRASQLDAGAGWSAPFAAPGRPPLCLAKKCR